MSLDQDGFVVWPDEADRFVDQVRDRSDVTMVEWGQFGGRTAYQVSVGTVGKPHVYVTRPHAHEPAGTAACFEWLKRLIAPKSEWDRYVLENFRISFMPDANPSGSARAPVKFWDGAKIPNEMFFLWMFGESGEAEGERFPRLASWRIEDVISPRRIGIAYEQIDSSTYVEPNRDHRSTFFKAYFDLHNREPVDVWVDLHQTEYIGSDRNAHVNLPTNVDTLEARLESHTRALANQIHERWATEGAVPRDSPQVPYQNNKVQYDFLNVVWSSITSATLTVITEVQNNNPRTPVHDQVRFQFAAIDQAIRYVDTNREDLLASLATSREKANNG